MNTISTRRNFLKAGAIVAAPLMAAAPAIAGPADDARERLARLEDLDAIRDLHAAWLRALNARRFDEASALFADPRTAPHDDSVRALTPDADAAPIMELAADRKTATLRAACVAQTETPITPSCPLVEMAKLQGEGVIRATQRRTLTASFVKGEDGAWKIARAEFAPAPA